MLFNHCLELAALLFLTGINIPIYEGVTEYNLLAGAGTMKLGQQMGQGKLCFG